MPRHSHQASPASTPLFRPSIRVTVVTTFIIATLLTALVAVALQYYFTRHLAEEAAVQRFNSLAESSGQFLATMDHQASQVARLLATYPQLVEGKTVSDEVRDLFAELLRIHPMFYAIYLGFEDGDLYQLINLNSGSGIRRQLQAEMDDRWALITISGEGPSRRREVQFLQADFSPSRQWAEASDYDATQRPWYIQARAGRVNKTRPYLFQQLQAPGQSYSIRLANHSAVLAVDITLSSLSDYLYSHRHSAHSEVYVYQPSGEVIASDVPHELMPLPSVDPLPLTDDERVLVANSGRLRVANELDWAPIDFSVAGQPSGYSVDFLHLLGTMTGLQFRFVNGYSWPELVTQYQAGDIDVLQPVLQRQSESALGLASDGFVSLPYSLVTRDGHAAIQQLDQIDGWTLAIPRGWSIAPILQTEYPTLTLLEVANSRAMFEAVLDGRADAGLDVTPVLHYIGRQFFLKGVQFHDNLSFVTDKIPHQLRFVFHPQQVALRDLVNRAIASLQQQHGAWLANKWFASDTLLRGTVAHQELIALAQQPDKFRQLLATEINHQPYFLYVTPFGEQDQERFAIVIPREEVLQSAQGKVRLAALLTAGFLLLLMPLPWLFASPIVTPVKALARENEKIERRQYDQLQIPRSHIREIDDLGLSMGSMVDAIQAHEAKQVALMDAFIELIAQAIDDKSHHTAGHCARVPELALMLAQAAEQSQQEPFKDFAFRSDEERREFRVAAWLHDCGKITTPDYIVDKGSKLETIYNRIHEIRTRFEVLWRDAEIRYWQQCCEQPEGESQWRSQLQNTQAQLQDDFAFVAAMNVGGEFLSEDKQQRLHTLAQTTWVRHFSDRLGLSPGEEARQRDSQEQPLPCTEALLSDRPEHLIERQQEVDYDPRLGIRMDVPPLLYNRGELYNLCIDRGTLTAEDRFKINEHIISTIRMLDMMPFPEELSKVPRYASTHHETLKGTGYPRQLSGDQLSIPERIMVLADIFEALTAADRPYKKAKKVSVAVEILASMVDSEHVDRDVFELFLRSGVYRQYAQKFLPSEQIDSLDINRYLRDQGAT